METIGILYLILTFAACFTVVHVIKLTYIGFLSVRKKKSEPKSEPKPKPKQKPEKKSGPIYYIVEKKRARKATYSEPKEIEFK